MLALSIRQPEASLIAFGEKTIEHRTWTTPHRGRLLICASAKSIYDAGGIVAPGGFAICTVTLTGIEPFTTHHMARACMPEFILGYAWLFDEVQEIVPFRVKGKLRLFSVKDEIQPLPDEFEDHIDYIERLSLL